MKNRNQATNTSGIAARIMPVEEIKNGMNVVLYGPSSSGKTTLACDFPGPKLLLDINDKGTRSVADHDDLDVLEMEEWVDLEQTYWFLKKNKKKYKTVILDTVTMAQQLCMKYVLDEKGGSTNGGLLTQKDWGNVGSLLLQQLMNYRDLDGLNKVFICQEKLPKEEQDDNEDGQIRPPVMPRVMPSVAGALNAAVDIIGHTFIRETWTKKRTEDKRIIKKKKTDYCLRIGPHAYYTTKVRKSKSIVVPDLIVDPTYKKLVANLEE